MAVIDPAADVERYLAVAEEMHATITDVFDTHLHAAYGRIGFADEFVVRQLLRKVGVFDRAKHGRLAAHEEQDQQ